MVVIKFIRNGKLYTWFIHENLAATFIFFVVLIGGGLIKIFWPNKKKIKHNLPPSGGTDIVNCLVDGKSYELIDDAMKRLFRQKFNEGGTSRLTPVFISATVFFYTYLLSATKINRLFFTGVEIYMTNVVALAVKGTLSAGFATALLTYLGTPQVIGILLGIVVAGSVTVIFTRLNCSDFVRELPMTRVETETKGLLPHNAVFLDEPQDDLKNRIFIVDTENTQLYVPQRTEYEFCSEKMEEVYLEIDNVNPTIPWQKFYRKTPAISRKCYSDRKYIPLQARTKTMDDLKKDDVSTRKEIAQEYAQQYNENRVKNRIEKIEK